MPLALVMGSLMQQGFQLRPVGGDHLQFRLGRLDDHRHLVGIGADQGLAPLKLGDGAHLAAGKLQGLLHRAGLVRLQVQDDFVFRVENGGIGEKKKALPITGKRLLFEC